MTRSSYGGACERPSVLLVDGAGARAPSPPTTSGDSPRRRRGRACATRRPRPGGSPRSAPPATRLVRYATVSHDGRHAGRGGLGAVLGGKRSRRWECAPATKVAPADPRRGAGGLPRPARPLAPARRPRSTARSAPWPTCLPSTHFRRCRPATSRQRPSSPHTAAGDRGPPDAQGRARSVRLVLDRLRAHLRLQGRQEGPGGVRERVRARADVRRPPSPTPSSPPAPAATSSAWTPSRPAGTIAWAMECAERGLIDAPWLRFGDGGGSAAGPRPDRRPRRSSVASSPRAPASPPRRSARQPRADFAPHVKGLEIPGYEPRTIQTMALGLGRQRARRRPQQERPPTRSTSRPARSRPPQPLARGVAGMPRSRPKTAPP